MVGNPNVLYVGYRNARRRFQTPLCQSDIHGRGDVSPVFELHRQRFKRHIVSDAFDFFTRSRPTTQLQLHKLVARIPIVARRGNGIAAGNLHRHDRQAIVGLKRPSGSPTPAKRPNTAGNHHHDQDRKTNCDQPMMGTAFLGRYIPLRLSI